MQTFVRMPWKYATVLMKTVITLSMTGLHSLTITLIPMEMDMALAQRLTLALILERDIQRTIPIATTTILTFVRMPLKHATQLTITATI